MGKRYIDADALKDKMQTRHEDLARDYGDYDNYVMGFHDALELLENTPTADVQEVKHGKWEHYGEYCQCSNCEHVTEDYCIDGDNKSWYYTALPNYCSNCGYKMDLEENENEH